MTVVAQNASAGGLEDLSGPIVTLILLLLIYRIMLGGFRRKSPDRARRASIEMRSLSGGNLGIVLATFAIAQLAYALPKEVGLDVSGLTWAIGLGLTVALFSYSRLGERVIGIAAIVSFLLVVFLRDGPEAGLAFITIAVVLFMSLSVLRFSLPKA